MLHKSVLMKMEIKEIVFKMNVTLVQYVNKNLIQNLFVLKTDIYHYEKIV